MSATEPRLGGPSEPTWRSRVENALYAEAKWMPDQINYFMDQVLAEHAHELAEKIRAKAADADVPGQRSFASGADAAAAWIDPKKEGQ